LDPALNLPPLNVPALLRAHGIHPKKSLGQNFLLDPSALEGIVAAAEISREDSVLEIGPGLGSLTRYLAAAARRVVAVELDGSLIPLLQDVLAGAPNVTIVHNDILEANPVELMGEDGYAVVANIPYYITSAVIRHLLEAALRPTRLVLTVQREVAERITARPGDMSLLALSVQVYGRPRIVLRVPAEAFYPPPKIDSSAVRVDLYPQPLIPAEQMNTFFQLAKAGFGQKRKTLRNSLSGGLGWPGERAAALLTAANIDPMRRAETLSMDEWKILTQEYLSS
jgi:16S rRNA (adenine1518-N6/adenine1519-N6)-dimethyltransferase